MVDYTPLLRRLLADPLAFAEHAGSLKLRRYQEAVAWAVVDSVLKRRGLTIVVMFPRQSGKNELQAQLEAYLLMLFSEEGGELVKVSPTWKPQSQNAMRRLERVLERNLLTRGRWEKGAGYLYRIGRAQVAFFSGAPEANIVGATASLLLEVDEAQDVSLEKFDKAIAPMAAATNATRVLWGTAWTADTLLARELRAAREAERQDGLRRVFTLSADEVAEEVPEYGKHVAGQVARLGREHPMVRTQYFNQELDAAGGLFDARRLALLQGDQPECFQPRPGCLYALTLDVAGAEPGADAGLGGGGGEHDRSAALVFEVDLAPLADPLLRAPAYRLVSGIAWQGLAQVGLYGRVKALIELWRPQRVVVDATGLGAGLAAFLERTFPGRIKPFLFTAASKSRLGWDFLSALESGRFKVFRAQESHPLLAELWREFRDCAYELGAGPGRSLRWGAPAGGKRHDDLVVAAALAVVLDGEPWSVPGGALVLPRRDPLEERSEY